ncbi:uncharacterized protein TNCV_2501331 [Trichonephila clavipes]|nr:uncharacterized protein TNCV_2501331 [Trichonephila clavipes]
MAVAVSDIDSYDSCTIPGCPHHEKTPTNSPIKFTQTTPKSNVQNVNPCKRKDNSNFEYPPQRKTARKIVLDFPANTSHAENVALKKKLNSCELIGLKNIPEINRRSVLAMRYIGQGLSSLETFCSLMCLPNPVSQKAYDRINAKIADISEALANASMKKAAAEEKIIEGTVNSVVVSGDGTWKTRGHTSLIGVCALIGADCGKVLDIEVMSSYCKGCDSYKGPKFGPKYSAFLAKHQIFCRKNHSGSAGGMEVCRMQKIFFRSEQKHGFKYQRYIGDGDSKDIFVYC